MLPYPIRIKLKQQKRRILNKLKEVNTKKITLNDVENLLLEDFGLKGGDKIIIASSFGNLNADFTPKQLIELLQSIITTKGIIMMPYYPPGKSFEWAKSGAVFDMQLTKSSMGILTNIFSQMGGVLKSKHPTKAVCVWGDDAPYYVEDHKDSVTPFSEGSPYEKLLRNGSRSLGLGLKNIPIFHTFEDLLLFDKEIYYESEKYNLPICENGKIEYIFTYVHDDNISSSLVRAGNYVRELNCHSYKRKSIGYAFCYIIDNSDLFECCKKEFTKDNTRMKK